MQTERRDCEASALHASETLVYAALAGPGYYRYGKPYLALNSPHQ